MRILQAAYACIMREIEVQHNKMIDGGVSVERESDARVCPSEDQSHSPCCLCQGSQKAARKHSPKPRKSPFSPITTHFLHRPLLQASSAPIYCNHPSKVQVLLNRDTDLLPLSS